MSVRVLFVVLCLSLQGCASQALQPWHKFAPSKEFALDQRDRVVDFAGYLELEDSVFKQQEQAPFMDEPHSSQNGLMRYSRGSTADPTDDVPNWNRSFEWSNDAPVGGVLLLHGMSDSPYSLRAIGETLRQQGYWVIGLRLPGHGTTPAGLLDVRWEDMAAVVQMAAEHLSARIDGRPLHVIGYSTGATLALNFALDALDRGTTPPQSLVLISPAIGLHGAAALAQWKRRLALVPGLGGLAWLTIEAEFDPYKYNSFTTNAAEQVHRLTQSVAQRLAALQSSPRTTRFPRTLVFKSNLDATVSTSAVVTRLLNALDPGRHELVLFDANRYAAKSMLLINDPQSLAIRLLGDESLPFRLTLVTNEHPDTLAAVAHHQLPFSREISETTPLSTPWPAGVLSLSHVALPFPPDDPLYGRTPPADASALFLGLMDIKGERGSLTLSADWLLRMRHNPFYDYTEHAILRWLAMPADAQ